MHQAYFDILLYSNNPCVCIFIVHHWINHSGQTEAVGGDGNWVGTGSFRTHHPSAHLDDWFYCWWVDSCHCCGVALFFSWILHSVLLEVRLRTGCDWLRGSGVESVRREEDLPVWGAYGPGSWSQDGVAKGWTLQEVMMWMVGGTCGAESKLVGGSGGSHCGGNS